MLVATMARKPYGIYSVEDRRVSSRYFRLLLAQGVFERPQKDHCDCCFQTAGPIEWHREDYSIIDPAGLITICYLCHRVLHMRDKWPGGWDAYRDRIREGGQYPWTNSIAKAGSIIRNTPYPLHFPNEARERTPLDDVHDETYLFDAPDIRRARMDAMYEQYARALAESEPQGALPL